MKSKLDTYCLHGTVESFDRETCKAQAVLDAGETVHFFSTNFHATPSRFPTPGERVSVVFRDGRLVLVRAVN